MSVINLHHFEKTYEGYWWSPEDPDHRCYGRLECRPGDRTELHVLSMGENAGIRFPNMPAILCGQAEGERLTLWKCFQFRTNTRSHRWGNEFKASYSVQVVIPGHEVSDKDDLRFTEAEFSLEHLSDWVGKHLIDRSRMPTDHVVRFQLDDDFKFQISDEIEGALCQRVDVDHPDLYSSTISQSDSILLRFTEPRTLNEIKGEMASWRWLLTLLMGRPVAETRLSVKNDSSAYDTATDVFFNPGKSYAYPKNLRDFEMTCPFSEVHDEFEAFVARWQAVRLKYPAVLQRYFSVQFKHGLYTNEEFLFLAHALEAFWRAENGDGPTFKKCIEGCLGRMPSFVRKFIDERPEFVSEVVDQRNYYTHYNPKLEQQGKVLDGSELYLVSQRVRLMIEVLLLQELGLSESIVNRAGDRQRMRKLIEYQ